MMRYAVPALSVGRSSGKRARRREAARLGQRHWAAGSYVASASTEFLALRERGPLGQEQIATNQQVTEQQQVSSAPIMGNVECHIDTPPAYSVHRLTLNHESNGLAHSCEATLRPSSFRRAYRAV